MEVVAQSNSCSVCVYTYRGKGEAQMLYKYCFNILNKPWCGEFSNSCEPEEKSSWLREQKTDSFQRPTLNIEIFDTFENYFLGKRDFFFLNEVILTFSASETLRSLRLGLDFLILGCFLCFSWVFCSVWFGGVVVCFVVFHLFGFWFLGFFLMGFQLP